MKKKKNHHRNKTYRSNTGQFSGFPKIILSFSSSGPRPGNAQVAGGIVTRRPATASLPLRYISRTQSFGAILMTYYIISTRQRPSALNYSRELPSKATKSSNMAEPLGWPCTAAPPPRGRDAQPDPRAAPLARGPRAYLLRRASAEAPGSAPHEFGRRARTAGEPGGPLLSPARTQPPLAHGGTLGRAFAL